MTNFMERPVYTPPVSRNPGRPRIIRRVRRTGRDGRVKVARDNRLLIQVERIRAQITRQCNYHNCPYPERIIKQGTEYAMLDSLTTGRRMGSQFIPDAKPYHFDCLPPEARPLVRFFYPMS